MHKVSKSRSTKNFETSPNNNSKENQQSTALQKKRERYHSQRRKGAPNPNYDCLGMNNWLKTSNLLTLNFMPFIEGHLVWMGFSTV